MALDRRPALLASLVLLALPACDAAEPEDTQLRALPPGAGSHAIDELAPEPSSVVNGTDVGTCGYASVGGYGYDPFSLTCTVVLVAPDVVLTAAHCLAAVEPTEIHFGEQYDMPSKVVPVESCEAHPQYDGSWADIAVCVLAEPVEDIAVTPILAGCELDLIGPGVPLEVVGFGASSAIYDENLPPDFPYQVDGVGTKRKTTQAFDDILFDVGQLWMLGDPRMNNSSCFGDSGGPVFARLPDGATRVAGLGQQIHPENPNLDPCGYGIVYQLVTPHIQWLEATSGRDLTPCWTGEAWTPGPTCGPFARDPELEVGTWASGCLGGGIEDVATLQCASTPGDETGDETDTTSEGESSTSGESESESSSEGESTSSEGDSGDELADEVGSESGPGIDWDPDGRGCACRAEPGPGDARGSLGLLALALLALARRRRIR